MGAFEENVDKACKELVIPGAVMIASTADGHFRYEKAFGVSSLKSNAPMKLDATMWIASCTKLVTTVAALQCVERGQLKLDDDVVSILPELKDRPILKGFDKKTGEPILVPNSKTITLRHLLTHSSGLSYDVFSPKLQKYRAYQKRKFGMKETFGRRNVAEANDFPLVFAPGKAWEYSVGIDFAGEMVARVNKTTLEEYFKKNIWGPLDTKNITFFPKASSEVMARLADMSEREGGLTLLGTAADPNGKVKYTEKTIWSLNTKHCFGGAGLYGSPLEYHKILQSICANDERLLKRSSVAEMFKPQLTDAARERLEFFLSIPDMNQGMGGLPEERKVDWGLGGLLNLTAALGRSAGSMTWGGYPNLTWWIDPVGGVSGMFGTQIYPQGDLKAVEICNEFSTEVYRRSSTRGKL